MGITHKLFAVSIDAIRSEILKMLAYKMKFPPETLEGWRVQGKIRFASVRDMNAATRRAENTDKNRIRCAIQYQQYILGQSRKLMKEASAANLDWPLKCERVSSSLN
ncbi:hypothetical protein J6590_017767 [Homalodisca vitripennis]|nr:hypothetical protein J6590_017767 [Homalodisca vitripennis]